MREQSKTKQELKARCKSTVAWLDAKGFKRIVDEDREILEFLLSEVDLDPRPQSPMLGAKGCYLNGYKRGYEDAQKAGYVKLAEDQTPPVIYESQNHTDYNNGFTDGERKMSHDMLQIVDGKAFREVILEGWAK